MKARLLPAAAALLLSGCAGSQLVAQWNDPQFAGQPARGAKVMVACQAPDVTLRRLCADRLSEQLLTLGMQPLQAPEAGDGAPDEVKNNPDVIAAYLGTSH